MKKILITGANGMLGKDLSRIILEEGYIPIETDIHNMNITCLDTVRNFMQKEKPDYVVHAAAYTNVDGAEESKDTAFLINKTGSENIARASAEASIPIVFVSTDYVFDGTKNSPYVVDDVTCPINVYGESKLAGEIAVKTNNPKYFIARTSWLYGHNGNNFVETMIKLAEKNSLLKVVDDQIGCPTWTVELAKGILKILKTSNYGTYHICGSGYTSWHGFAKKIMELMDINIEVQPVTTESFPRPAKRPKFSVMENNAICPNWQESLQKYIETRPNKKEIVK